MAFEILYKLLVNLETESNVPPIILPTNDRIINESSLKIPFGVLCMINGALMKISVKPYLYFSYKVTGVASIFEHPNTL